ncbi:MAG TPA: hypothetical protein VGJ15_01030, partial [Pirellulales bacterium]
MKQFYWLRLVLAMAAAVMLYRSNFGDEPEKSPAGQAAVSTPSPVARLMKLLQSGKLPPENVPTVIGMVCDKGTADDLAVVYQQATKPDAWPKDTRLKAFDLLADAMATRKIKPSGELNGLEALIAGPAAAKESALQLKAIRLAGLWKLSAVAGDLQQAAISAAPASALQTAAIDSLAAIGDKASLATLEKMAAHGQPQPQRYRTIAALARCDVNLAAKSAAAALVDASPNDNLGVMLDDFLRLKNGPDTLAAALGNVKLQRDVARLALRYMYSTGHSEPVLANVLSVAADVPATPPLPTEDEVQKLATEVAAKGDAIRGESIFRSADLNCIKCHSLCKAGGEIGPELTAVGATSPVDYVVRSILNPDAQKKEAYETKIIVANGLQSVGIEIERNNETVKLKDATGRIVSIPIADIEEEGKGKSLMPEGLTKFLTHQEFLDLAKFVSELGKPGPFAPRTVPIMQRYRVLREVPDDIATEVPNVELLRIHLLDCPPENWSLAYARISGALPVAEAAAARTALGGSDPADAKKA